MVRQILTWSSQSIFYKIFMMGTIWFGVSFLISCRPGEGDMEIVIQKPIVFDSIRNQLSLQYLEERYGLIQEQATILPQMIVLHWTAIPTMEETFETFNQSILPSTREGIQSAGALNVSAHYLVDRDGTIYQLLPDTVFARHVIGLNHCAIGIENVGGEELPLTGAQLKSNILLIEKLTSMYPIEYLIGHFEYTEFIGHELWLEKDPEYLTDKIDPGEDFMSKIRRNVQHLMLKSIPEN